MAARRLELYRFGGMTLDLARGSLRNGSGDVRLRPKSFDLLIYFVTNARRLLSKDELLQAVWPGVFVTEDSLVQCVKEIRRAVADGEQVLIKTIPGRGYIFDLPVTMVDLAETAPAGSGHPPGWLRRMSRFDWRIATAAALALSIGLGWSLIPASLERALPVAATAPPRAIVVLPFASLSGDPAQDYLADVVTDELTNSLSHSSLVDVVARSTAFAYKGKPVDAKQIGRELGVRYVLEGSVQRSATHVRVNAQLNDAQTGSHLWAESVDREGSDLFAIHDEIAKRIALTVWWQVVDIEAKRAERRGASEDATDYIFRATAAWRGGYDNKDTYRAVTELYRKAVQLDGHDRRALTGLADALTSAVGDGFSDAPEDDLQRAKELVSGVLATDRNYAYAHHIRANIFRTEKQYDEAIAEYEIELALNPVVVIARSHLAWLKMLVGEPAEAIPLLEQAVKISPFDQNIGLIHNRLGLANLLLGNVDESIRWSEKAVATFYRPSYAYLNLAAALALKGDKAAAQAALAAAIKRPPELEKTIAGVRGRYLNYSGRPKFYELLDRTVLEGLRQAGLPEGS